ncbi:phosphatase PAP2 family protein [Streptomyces kunmingensis]|uniref:Phosphatase PAP2 family protein n=1 Tax=Streptomyces kunmingensis TaxID=68225 RepID=A0ABU6CGG7_9ACTN|nr:phosphatase PAP2 family protein [Streptomyces kunmingensis]MEB3963106.1 phosphatase PAP2 family protein [Streptomyces kunmingensis]
MGTIDSDLYRSITEFAHDTPSWFQHLMEVWTELGLLLFAVLFVVAWARARGGDPRAFAVAVLAPLGTAVAYVCSELAKSGIDEERPCRAVSGALPSLVDCPVYGDWSFPSNHATIAAAAAVGLALAWPKIGLLTVPMAILMAFSRVFVGVHYPHDVAAGLLLGTLVTLLVVRLVTRPGARLTEAMRGSGNGLVRWFAGPGPVGAGYVSGAGGGRRGGAHRR